MSNPTGEPAGAPGSERPGTPGPARALAIAIAALASAVYLLGFSASVSPLVTSGAGILLLGGGLLAGASALPRAPRLLVPAVVVVVVGALELLLVISIGPLELGATGIIAVVLTVLELLAAVAALLLDQGLLGPNLPRGAGRGRRGRGGSAHPGGAGQSTPYPGAAYGGAPGYGPSPGYGQSPGGYGGYPQQPSGYPPGGHPPTGYGPGGYPAPGYPAPPGYGGYATQPPYPSASPSPSSQPTEQYPTGPFSGTPSSGAPPSGIDPAEGASPSTPPGPGEGKPENTG